MHTGIIYYIAGTLIIPHTPPRPQTHGQLCRYRLRESCGGTYLIIPLTCDRSCITYQANQIQCKTHRSNPIRVSDRGHESWRMITDRLDSRAIQKKPKPYRYHLIDTLSLWVMMQQPMGWRLLFLPPASNPSPSPFTTQVQSQTSAEEPPSNFSNCVSHTTESTPHHVLHQNFCE